MCSVCVHEDVQNFVFPRKNEDLHMWFHRLEHMEHLELAMMKVEPADLIKIKKSYEIQGFTFHHESEILNVLLIRDLIFVTYTFVFENTMGWN